MMSKIHKYAPDRLTLLAVASDYAKSNPGFTTGQLKQLFGLTTSEVMGVHSRLRSDDMANAESMKEAIDWAIQNNAGIYKIQNRYGFNESECRRVAAAAKIANEEKLAAAKAKLDVAIEYALANPLVPSREIACLFEVSFHSLERVRVKHRKQITNATEDVLVVPKQPRRNLRRLYAVFSDGRTCDPRLVKDWDYFVRFEKVVV